MGACVCMCMCVWGSFITSATIYGTYLRVQINDLVLRVLCWVLLPSFFISVSKNVIFHLQRQNSSTLTTVEKTICYIAPAER